MIMKIIGIIVALGAWAMIIGLLMSQVSGITVDETGISIDPPTIIDYTIFIENGAPTMQMKGDIYLSKYDLKSIPEIHGGDALKIDSFTIETHSGLNIKKVYITPY